MNILHTETLKRWGGQQNRVLMEATGLKKRGHKVIIACNRGSVLAKKAAESGIRVYELDLNKKTYFRSIPQLIKIIRKEGIEIVSTHSSVDSWAGGIAAKLTGRKLVRFRHNLYPVGRDPLTRFIYTMPDHLVAISHAIANLLVSRGLDNGKITVIHSSVDPEKFKNDAPDLRSELGIPDDAIVIGNTSTFTKVKGQEYLLRAFNELGALHNNCYLLIAGRIADDRKGKYLRHVDEKMRDRVILTGHREDIPRVLKTIDVFVYPSFQEGLGTALIEAMMMGRPVAVSDIETFRDFIQEGYNGIFFRPRNPHDITSKVIEMIESGEKLDDLGRNARKTAMERFSCNTMIFNTETLYKEILNGQ